MSLIIALLIVALLIVALCLMLMPAKEPTRSLLRRLGTSFVLVTILLFICFDFLEGHNRGGLTWVNGFTAFVILVSLVQTWRARPEKRQD